MEAANTATESAWATVVAADVSYGARGLGDEPVTTARLRDEAGKIHTVRIVGGPSRRGGTTRLAGYEVPRKGARARLDLRAPEPLTPAWLPSTPAGTWAASKLPVTFVLAGAQSRDLGEDTQAELDVALHTWGLVPCTSFRARFGGTAQVTPGDDGTNGVFFHDDAWPAELVPKALAQTIVHVDANGFFTDADIHVNGADHRFSKDGARGSVDTVDARGVLVHELGHALGLGHTTIPGATMTASHPPGLAWRSLETDDREGVCSLYPGVGARGCDEDPCPPSFVCVARQCERRFATKTVCSPCARTPGACEAAGDDARCLDLGDAGRVCGRACSGSGSGVGTADECGPHARCEDTTSSGDRQCVPTDGCASGPSPCVKDADCTDAVCRGGACVGPPDPLADAGADAGVGPRDAGPLPLAPAPSPSSCSAATPSRSAAPLVRTLVLLLGLALATRRART